MFVPFILFPTNNHRDPHGVYCSKCSLPVMLQIKSKIVTIACKAQHNLMHDTSQGLLPPSSCSLGFNNVSHLAVPSPPPRWSMLQHSQFRDFTVAVPLHGKLFPQIVIWFPPHFIQVSPEISFCERILLWLPSLNWPKFIIFYFFILLWFSSPPDITLYILIFFIAYVSNYNENSIRKFSVYFTPWYIPTD